jgi:hypothetical protein
MPIKDDEIVDRAALLSTFASGRTTLLTYDTGQTLHARANGVQAVKLTSPRDAESLLQPEPSR